MSLESRLQALISAIGADIKSLQGATKDQHNAMTAAQNNVFTSDTYLQGSNVSIPLGKIQVGTKYRCKFSVVKTSTGGTATPVITFRVGTAGAIGDTSRGTMTFAAQTAVADEGAFEIELTFRAAGATAFFVALGTLGHRLAATGLSTANHSVVLITSSTFDATAANLKLGISLNAGASAAWNVNLVSAELVNLAA